MKTERIEHCGMVARLAYRAANALVNLQCRNGRVYPSRFTLKLLQYSADQGMVCAMSDLGRFLYQCGVGRTVKRSGLEYIRQAARFGDTEAQFLLGKAYHNGELASKDDNAAAHWLALAADKGHPEALSELSAQIPFAGAPSPLTHSTPSRRSTADSVQTQSKTPTKTKPLAATT